MELAEYEEKHVRVTEKHIQESLYIFRQNTACMSMAKKRQESGSEIFSSMNRRLIPLRKRKCTEQRSSGQNG
ncbi:hypothetical protein SAMN06297397_1027 [Aristaeella lactis]|uniref:Uncharacterized protein n=1 Tax=Aristaeella lactis TaxID=3046383 RepID=A0AC61PJM4_9FIRM|nr:hypothetical protein SAMN06297397_1027 [Aristaeella lactis]